jgi:hypothetical protein
LQISICAKCNALTGGGKQQAIYVSGSLLMICMLGSLMVMLSSSALEGLLAGEVSLADTLEPGGTPAKQNPLGKGPIRK